jgi:Protein of unknown function (DUF3703)
MAIHPHTPENQRITITLATNIEQVQDRNMTPHERNTAVTQLLRRFESLRFSAVSAGNALPATQEQLWELLCAAHIAGQYIYSLHIQTHLAMLSFAWQNKQYAEATGQVFRLMLVPIGHALQRLPKGNSGRADISAFKPMEVPPKLQSLIAEAMKQPL